MRILSYGKILNVVRFVGYVSVLLDNWREYEWKVEIKKNAGVKNKEMSTAMTWQIKKEAVE